MTADRFTKVQDCLIGAGLIQKVRNGFNLPGYSQTSRFALTDLGCRELQGDKWAFQDFKVSRGSEAIRLKDSQDRLRGYDDTPEIIAMRSNLDEINAKLDASDIDTTRPLTIHDREPEYEGRKVHLHRVFNRDSFDIVE